jgi:tRNA(Ile)-lysidine synthase TilS/MesJ
VLPNNSILVTAHHLDDYQESYLQNCFRGQPTYRGISLRTNFGSYEIIHPFLLTEKSDLIEFLKWYQQGHFMKFVVTDETNTIVKGSRRNWIRNVIVPEMNRASVSVKKYCRRTIMEDIQREFGNVG